MYIFFSMSVEVQDVIYRTWKVFATRLSFPHSPFPAFPFPSLPFVHFSFLGRVDAVFVKVGSPVTASLDSNDP